MEDQEVIILQDIESIKTILLLVIIPAKTKNSVLHHPFKIIPQKAIPLPLQRFSAQQLLHFQKHSQQGEISEDPASAQTERKKLHKEEIALVDVAPDGSKRSQRSRFGQSRKG